MLPSFEDLQYLFGAIIWKQIEQVTNQVCTQEQQIPSQRSRKK